MSDQGKYEVRGDEGMFIIAPPDGPAVGVFYAESDPGWWRGHAHGRVKRLFIPCAEPLDVARRFLRP